MNGILCAYFFEVGWGRFVPTLYVLAYKDDLLMRPGTKSKKGTIQSVEMSRLCPSFL